MIVTGMLTAGITGSFLTAKLYSRPWPMPRCTPIVCKNGKIVRTCTKDGHPINYFADPCR